MAADVAKVTSHPHYACLTSQKYPLFTDHLDVHTKHYHVVPINNRGWYILVARYLARFVSRGGTG